MSTKKAKIEAADTCSEDELIKFKAITHTVKNNDTLRSIAATYLGSPTRSDEIASLNRLATPILPVGKKLRIPEK